MNLQTLLQIQIKVDMERIRIRSMLNYIKKTQKVQQNLKISDNVLKCSTQESNNSSCRNKDHQVQNQNTKLSSFTLDVQDHDGAHNAGADQSFGEMTLMSLFDNARKRVPIKCFTSELQRKKRSQSQNLEELGIEKKCLTSRKPHVAYNRILCKISHQKQISQKLRIDSKTDIKHNRSFSTHPQHRQTFYLDASQSTARNQKRPSNAKIQIHKKINDYQMRIRNLRTIDFPIQENERNQQICPWETLNESTNLHYTLNI